VFYSWQSDLPGRTNRNLIQTALKDAIRDLGRGAPKLDVRFERDTRGLAGSPDIVNAILAKIDDASAFVCDVTIVNPRSRKPTKPMPNPNVLFELGYAVRALGWDRVICVYNDGVRPMSDLPFDVRNRRILPYTSRLQSRGSVASERKRLREALHAALQPIVTGLGSRARSPQRLRDSIAAVQLRNAVGKLMMFLRGLSTGALPAVGTDAAFECIARDDDNAGDEFAQHLVESFERTPLFGPSGMTVGGATVPWSKVLAGTFGETSRNCAEIMDRFAVGADAAIIVQVENMRLAAFNLAATFASAEHFPELYESGLRNAQHVEIVRHGMRELQRALRIARRFELPATPTPSRS